MHPKKMEMVMQMNGPDRFGYFIRKTADFEEVWGLFDDGWATAANEVGRMALPFWPECEFAEACATGPWGGFEARSISLSEFLDRWLPGMSRDKRLVAVFPTTSSKGVFIEPAELADSLSRELQQYE